MAPGKGVDDIETMNAFLAMIGGAPLPEDYFDQLAPVVKTEPASDQDQAAEYNNQNSSGENTAGPPSPAPGTRAPPTTPASAPVIEKTLVIDLDPVEEHNSTEVFAKLADPKGSLQDSKYAHPQRRLYNTLPPIFTTITMPTPARGQEKGDLNKLNRPSAEKTRTTVQQEIMDKIAIRNAPVHVSASDSMATPPKMMSMSFEENVLAKFKARVDNNKGNVKETAKTTEVFPKFEDCIGEFATDVPPKTPTEDTIKGGVFITATIDSLSPDSIEFIPSPSSASQSPTKQNSGAVTNIQDGLEQNAENVAIMNSAQAILNNAKAELIAKTGRMSISVKEPGSPEAAPVVVFTASEAAADRENATHFASWGTPETRTGPRARVRMVILRNLPVGADLTLIQSLIHGGAIDTYSLGANGTATVTFTSADACERYFATYPNGITFKFQGKNHVIYVDKGNEVNVISGMLQGQLDCGASRCVRAIGADHDWGMGALIKLAEGRARKGKVENIADGWRNEIRTIIFRFTSIGDAVGFKAMLMRDEDWETCNIQFLEDPCEKAVGIHLE